ncbi:hypothetical protein BRADI_4g11036v3 [Brachypodium distachyon]|uniref:Uncharacterized protein n=1 Tax=Brachypodium distachyon TaxID=15368 RepID=A0A2K2CM13_BRADI|nr:hypothetical protein BRADI_4g11036v3 [Brachypodium distachyon]
MRPQRIPTAKKISTTLELDPRNAARRGGGGALGIFLAQEELISDWALCLTQNSNTLYVEPCGSLSSSSAIAPCCGRAPAPAAATGGRRGRT